MSEEKCKFYKKQFLSKYCELFKQPCYGKHCNFIKEFTRLNNLEQQLENAKEENELRGKMIELMADCIAENILKTVRVCRVFKEEKDPIIKRILVYYKQQSINKIEEQKL